MSDIQPGDVVVCVPGDCGNHADQVPTYLLVTGRHYTVAEVVPSEEFYDPDDPSSWCVGGVIVAEIPCASSESGYCMDRFRKLNDEPDNAEIVERIRKCRPIKVGVDA